MQKFIRSPIKNVTYFGDKKSFKYTTAENRVMLKKNCANPPSMHLD